MAAARMISPAQCRGARGLLGWSRYQCAVISGVPEKTLADYEIGRTKRPLPRTLARMVSAFQREGIRFLDHHDGVILVRTPRGFQLTPEEMARLEAAE